MTSKSKEEAEALRLAKLYEGLREKLLDLTLRNRMLNYRMSEKSKSQLRIVDEVPEKVYRRLVTDERSLRVQPLPDPPSDAKDEKTEEFQAELAHCKVSDSDYIERTAALDPDDPSHESKFDQAEAELRDKIRKHLGLPPRKSPRDVNRSDHARSHSIDPSPDLPAQAGKDKHDDGALQTLRYPDELDAVLDTIRSNARLAEQEMGLSTLFLAYGFLEWSEAEASSKKMFAPLLLLPVKLEVKPRNGRDEFLVMAREQDAETNLSLQKYLEKEWRLTLPTFAPAEDAKEPVEAYFDEVRKTVSADTAPGWVKERWKIRRWLVLGQFAFGRLAMYTDLDPLKWKGTPVSNPLVASVLRGTDGAAKTAEESFAIPENYDIDDPAIERLAPYLVHDADASQHSAMIDAMKGENLVIHGPPGTGKSQTITNIIANALGAGKKVLFLAEKQAALDVVKRRLQTASLGEFCLELHSDRLAPKTVIESIRQRVDIGFAGKGARTVDDSGWFANKRALRGYLEELHREVPANNSAFKDIWTAIAGQSADKDAFTKLRGVKLPFDDLETPSKLSEITASLSLFAAQSKEFVAAHGHPSDSPWSTTPLGNVNPADLSSLIEALAGLKSVAEQLTTAISSHRDFGLVSEADLQQAVEADKLLPHEVPSVAGLAGFSAIAIEAALVLVKEALAAEAARAKLQAPGSIAGTGEATLRQLAELELPKELLTKTPHSLASQLPTRLKLLNEQSSAITKIVPVLSALGFDGSLPFDAARTISATIATMSEISDDWLEWYAKADIDPRGFPAVCTRWHALLQEERRWRERFPGSAGRAWPAIASLQSAATEAGQGHLSRFFQDLGNRNKALSEVSGELGIKNRDAISKELDTLTTHVHALISFENDVVARTTLGNAWDGLNTDFKYIEEGLSHLASIKSRLSGYFEGPLIADRLLNLIISGKKNLGELRIAYAAFANNFSNSDVSHGRRTVDDFHETCLKEIKALRTILDVGISKDLEQLNSPLGILLEALTLQDRRTDLHKQLGASEVGKQVLSMIHHVDDIGDVEAAAKWLGLLRRCHLPNIALERLVSSDAEHIRHELEQIAEGARDLLVQKNELLERIGKQYNFLHLGDLDLLALKSKLTPLLSANTSARDLLLLRRAQEPLRSAGLQSFIEQAEALRLPYERLEQLLLSLLAFHRATRAIRGGQQLSVFGPQIEARRSQFAKHDAEKLVQDRATLRSRLLKCNPPAGSDFGSKKTWTELALLRKEIDKSTRHEPVRALLTRASRAMQELKPCFMMSPLSLAKFSGDKALQFDLLVIDEASQMRPEDALGGLLRSKQVVVVGDRKQLPPTDFFSRSSTPQDDDDEKDDIISDSILENCETAFRRVRRLSWHYRSRCESLIRFANKYFYENKLVTFPAPVPNSFSIDHVKIAGSYRGSRNQAEANEIVEAAISFIHEHYALDEKAIPSLGLVAINSQQRDLIREEFSRLTAADSKVSQFLESVQKKGEEFFVKNLENVQGDERDYIYVSMTYGPEPGSTVMHQRFGPINSSHGHRRLNVLFSRARIRIGLFSSFGSADLLPSESSREGVHALKKYLEYVEAKGIGLADSAGPVAETLFEQEVMSRLESRGYRVDAQVGVSGYRIDLGVRHPEEPSRYLAGIECDGATYHSSKSARDRDRLREDILRGLGWKIIRQWSTDWFHDPGAETDKLVKRLEGLRESGLVSSRVFTLRPSAVVSSEEPETITQAMAVGRPPTLANVVADAAQTSPERGPAGKSDFDANTPLSASEARDLLAKYRDVIIRPASQDWDASRSILRDSMIEMFMAQKFDDPEDWTRKVPMYLRQGTAPGEKKHLDRITDIVARIASSRNP